MGVSIVKLTSDNETLAEGKVIILYILNKLPNPVSNESLYKLVLSINDMNYFYFQQFLLDLINNKYKTYDKYLLDKYYNINDLNKLFTNDNETYKDIINNIKNNYYIYEKGKKVYLNQKVLRKYLTLLLIISQKEETALQGITI